MARRNGRSWSAETAAHHPGSKVETSDEQTVERSAIMDEAIQHERMSELEHEPGPAPEPPAWALATEDEWSEGDEPSTPVEEGSFEIVAYGQGDGGVREFETHRYGQVQMGYPGQYGTKDGWQGDSRRGVAAHPQSGSVEADRHYFQFRDITDITIAESIHDRLREGWLNAEAVEISVQAGRVSLHGFVERREDKRLLEELISDIPGVRGIENALRVAQPDDPHGLPSSDGAAR